MMDMMDFLEHLFAVMDDDNSGSLSDFEFDQALQHSKQLQHLLGHDLTEGNAHHGPHYSTELFSQFDSDGGGYISKKEFMDYSFPHMEHIHSEDDMTERLASLGIHSEDDMMDMLEHLFAGMDHDNSGSLSDFEFEQALRESKQLQHLLAGDFSEGNAHHGPHYSTELFLQFDSDGGGSISQQEFMDYSFPGMEHSTEEDGHHHLSTEHDHFLAEGLEHHHLSTEHHHVLAEGLEHHHLSTEHHHLSADGSEHHHLSTEHHYLSESEAPHALNEQNISDLMAMLHHHAESPLASLVNVSPHEDAQYSDLSARSALPGSGADDALDEHNMTYHDLLAQHHDLLGEHHHLAAKHHYLAAENHYLAAENHDLLGSGADDSQHEQNVKERQASPYRPEVWAEDEGEYRPDEGDAEDWPVPEETSDKANEVTERLASLGQIMETANADGDKLSEAVKTWAEDAPKIVAEQGKAMADTVADAVNQLTQQHNKVRTSISGILPAERREAAHLHNNDWVGSLGTGHMPRN